jgi:ABC-type glutathione transport system ATPase component
MNPVIEVRNVSKIFHRKRWFSPGKDDGVVRAVDTVSISIDEGESVGLAGESGCGKTTLGRLIAGLYKPTDGSVSINGRNINDGSKDVLRQVRRDCRMIFQNLDAALNPFMTVRQILEEPLLIHTEKGKTERHVRIREILELVNLPAAFMNEYPHTLSGGEKRRVSVARAIAVPPKILIADEPVSALDVSIRAQIIDLFQVLRKELNLTMVFISHDLGVLNDVCDRLLIMYNGRIVEDAPIEKLRTRTLVHPYSKRLIASVLQISTDSYQ